MFSIPSFLLSSFCCSFYSQIVSCLLPSSSYFHCSPVLFCFSITSLSSSPLSSSSSCTACPGCQLLRSSCVLVLKPYASPAELRLCPSRGKRCWASCRSLAATRRASSSIRSPMAQPHIALVSAPGHRSWRCVCVSAVSVGFICVNTILFHVCSCIYAATVMSHHLFNIVITLGLRHTGLITLHSSVFVQVKFQKEQRALRMHLEDSTMEEALWALGQVNGPCSLSLRTKQDGEHVSFHLLKQIQNTACISIRRGLSPAHYRTLLLSKSSFWKTDAVIWFDSSQWIDSLESLIWNFLEGEP